MVRYCTNNQWPFYNFTCNKRMEDLAVFEDVLWVLKTYSEIWKELSLINDRSTQRRKDLPLIMAHCFNVEDGYHQICDESDCGESPSKYASLGRHRKPWQWAWRWVSAQKNSLCRALAIDNEDGLMLRCCRRLSWKNVCWKMRTELSRMIKPKPASHMTFRYDALSYALNFDDGGNYQAGPDNA